MGRCNARKGGEDFLIAYNYGKVSSICTDPVEKKPLYHFMPGSKIFSVGGVGCNMSCKNCQNYAISQTIAGRKRTTYESPEEIVAMCRKDGLNSIAFTYNEPAIWIEYILDITAADPDLKCAIISNGLINEKPLRDLCKVSDAFNIDIKGFRDEFYVDICKAHLKDVLASVKIIFEEGIHLELTYLVIPGMNDSDEEIGEFCDWVKNELSPDIPVHFSRFHPDFEMMNVPSTPVETVIGCKRIAYERGLKYAYVGNVVSEGCSDTVCPHCGETVIGRLGYLVDMSGLNGNKCARCGTELPIIR